MYQNMYQTLGCHAKEKVKYMAWTSEMDRCLVKILAEQTEKGNKMDGSLKPAAYMAAITIINEKFGLNLTNEHIRNRLKTWKKQFGILKKLLAHKGFEWDEAQKMVVADKSVWNDYVKVHPDARQFRARFIENYNELCLIVGNDQPTGNKDGMGTVTVLDFQNIDNQIKKFRWTEEMTCFFLGDIIVEQVIKGHKIDNILQCEAYDSTLSALNEKFGPELTKDHIRSQLRAWKKEYGILKELLSHTGFKWDDTRRIIDGSDSAWNDYIKTHPDARIFHAKVIENYDQLCLIFGNYNEAAEAVNACPIQNHKVKDKVRNMMWTKEMDRCLSRILVEQVRIGNKNKFNNKFRPAAYIAAVSALNERFQLDLTKDHVRNRLKTWKKQCDILKELENHGNFEWDGTRKMVVANDYVWNQYVRRNPDAKQLQGHAINNYDELCIIFGYDDLPESSLDGDDANLNLTAVSDAVDVDDALYNRRDNAKEKGKYISWTEEMDHCLVELLLEQVRLGNKLGKNFKATAYTAVLAVLNEKFALELTKDNIRNRLKTWKKLYGLITELLSHSGFGWDERRKMVVACDSKWNEYIKRNPDARHLRAKSIENFNELRIIVGNEQAAGNWSETVGKAVIDTTQNNQNLVETPLHKLVGEETSQDESDDDLQGSSHQTRARPFLSSDSKQPYKRRRANDVMKELMTSIAANIGRIADALTENKSNVCWDELFQMVQNISGLDDDLIIEACEYLSFDEKRARMFVKLDDRLRRIWLLKRLRGQAS